MTPEQQHRQQRERIVASLLLADTRSERHGVYKRRKPVRRQHEWSMPVVNERKL